MPRRLALVRAVEVGVTAGEGTVQSDGRPDLSVVIPVYGRQRSVLRAVDSVLSQPGVNAEIIVVDDASPEPVRLDDHTGRVRLVRRSVNGGASAARNEGLALAAAPLVTFLDSDDHFLPDTLAARLAAARNLDLGGTDPVAVGCGWVEVSGGRAIAARIPREPGAPTDFLGGCWVNPGSAVLFNRAAIKAAAPFDESMRRLEDVDFFIRFAAAGGRFRVDSRLGVAIVRGAHRHPERIETAATALSAKYGDAFGPAERRRLNAYLELERARLAWTVGHPLRFGLHLLRSWSHHPRARLNTGPGWQAVPVPRLAPQSLSVLD
ncbi:glycosyltransferase family 2 protein [Zhengella mangrovi]|uniref:glycosyltransferase family 2 protein n=1 Tax=Zhengella mangrovi TaxID=1982044 RepID=UPI0013FDF740|nr:glycosyltransferase family 2 protein [Zhengella mangrovi]